LRRRGQRESSLYFGHLRLIRLGHWRSRPVGRHNVIRTKRDEKRRKIPGANEFCVEFIDLASKAFADALLQTSIQDPSKVILLYATMGKLRRFASERTVEAAEKAMT
jgi:hypothetical protein